MFENFKKIRLVPGSVSISVTKNGLTFSRQAVSQMEMAEYVNLLLNEEEHKLAIQYCDEKDKDKVRFAKDGNLNVRWNNRVFLDNLLKLMNWEKDKIYRIGGEYISSHKALLFNLDNFEVGEAPEDL